MNCSDLEVCALKSVRVSTLRLTFEYLRSLAKGCWLSEYPPNQGPSDAALGGVTEGDPALLGSTFGTPRGNHLGSATPRGNHLGSATPWGSYPYGIATPLG
jgi:hypothetical protein